MLTWKLEFFLSFTVKWWPFQFFPKLVKNASYLTDIFLSTQARGISFVMEIYYISMLLLIHVICAKGKETVAKSVYANASLRLKNGSFFSKIFLSKVINIFSGSFIVKQTFASPQFATALLPFAYITHMMFVEFKNIGQIKCVFDKFCWNYGKWTQKRLTFR